LACCIDANPQRSTDRKVVDPKQRGAAGSVNRIVGCRSARIGAVDLLKQHQADFDVID